MNVSGSGLPNMADFSRIIPSYKNDGTDQLHTSQFAPKGMDFKVLKVLPSELGTSAEEIKIKMPDGSIHTGKALFDHQAVLSRHYSEGSITNYQDKLISEGQRPISKLIQQNDKIVGVELNDGSRRWFDEKAYRSLSEDNSEDLDTLLKNNNMTSTSAKEVTYAEAYNNAMGSNYLDFVNAKVNDYRMSAERFFSS